MGGGGCEGTEGITMGGGGCEGTDGRQWEVGVVRALRASPFTST